MAGFMTCDGNIVLPRTNTYRFNVRCRGRKCGDEDGAELIVRKRGEAEAKIRKIAHGFRGLFRFEITPKDTEQLEPGTYLYDITIVTNANFEGVNGLEATERTDLCVSLFAPTLRKFQIAEAIDDVSTQGA